MMRTELLKKQGEDLCNTGAGHRMTNTLEDATTR